MKKVNLNVTKFEVKDDFYVMVMLNEEDKTYEFTLCRKNYAIKRNMFALPVNIAPEEIWEKIIEEKVDEYIHYLVEDWEKFAKEPLNPSNIPADTHLEFWWKTPCNEGEKSIELSWKSAVSNRVDGNSCPI